MTIRSFVHILEHSALATGIAGACGAGALAAFQTTEPAIALLAATGATVLTLPLTLAIAFVGAELLTRAYLRWTRYCRRFQARVQRSHFWRVDARLSTLAREEASRC